MADKINNKNMKKILIVIIVVAAVGAGAFYAGIKYNQSKSPFGGARALSQEGRQQRFQELGTNMEANIGSGFMGGRTGERFANGEIIAKDDKSVTIKLRDGGSKIVFFSETAEIGKFISGTLNDLEIGKTATINGEVNQDGSITAKSIQIRPEISQ